MNRLAAAFCRSPSIPLGLRRKLAHAIVPYSAREFTVEIDGAAYRGRLDNYIEWVAYVTGQYYEYTYLNLIRSFDLGGCAIDVGGNVGNHATAFAHMFDEVVSVEPYPPLFQRLKEKTSLLGNVRAYNVAFGEDDAEMGFAAPSGRNLGSGHLDENSELRVAVARADSFLPGKHSAPIRFIKVDVEGHEAAVLGGMRKTLEKARPVVLYEAPKAFHGPASDSLRDSFGLLPEDYRFWGLRGQSSFPVQRRIARAIPLIDQNLRRRYAYVLAVPREKQLSLPPHP